ncbi:hypothetical protein [Arenimonas sp. MALMAid1274]|uniref:hypothetical protein n=1 Tax=Arenimonas sp. MALMAid1274 TaxID=3411630 RepID=UPI003BA3643C
MPKTLILLMLAAASGALAAPPVRTVLPSELFLAGGSLRTCSDLAPGACRTPARGGVMRTPPQYRVDAEGTARALDPLLWKDRTEAPARAELAALLRALRRNAAWDRDAIEDAMDAHCAQRACRRDPAARPWRRLLDDERAALLSALEIPQMHDGQRLRERARPGDSIEGAGVDVLRAFIAAAAKRSGAAPPRIAIVTASSQDPFEAVDFYLDTFRQLGADARWWPVDAALNAAVFQGGECDGLEALRRGTLRIAARDRVYPDLARQQQQACRDAAATQNLPREVHGIFFAGGDQWLHRQAFFDRDDRPNAWLLALREAHARGDLVVGGTSAGTAVQGGAAMLSNGDSAQALVDGARARAPMQPGCGRARRCADGLSEDTLTYWPAGGLGLLPGWSVDTHFSERARELRLLVLMHAAQADLAMGVDETTAVHVSRLGGRTRLEAIGARGAWVFERGQRGADGSLSARAHYLVPGAVLELTPGGLEPMAPLPSTDIVLHFGPEAEDALADRALRSASRSLSGCPDGNAARTLRAGAGRVTLACTPATVAWSHSAQPSLLAERLGILNFDFRYEPGTTTP